MMYPKIPLAQSIIEICSIKGVSHIVISPGSRNAPLTIGFVNNPYFTCYSIVDERCAAFFALGIAQQIQKPVAVVCTSGSALLNYYPAIAEAFYSQIPLLVITADRPADKIDIGDGQTIRQQDLFKNHSLFNANLSEGASFENDFKINQAIDKALFQKGPAHINAPFEEPLYETISEVTVAPEIMKLDSMILSFSMEEIMEAAANWNSYSKKLILVGVAMPGELEQPIIDAFANDDSVVVMTETISNLHHPTFITNIDTIITPFTGVDFENFQPDILITFGGMVVSKRIKALLRLYPPKLHWHIDALRAYDTYGCLTTHFKGNPNIFFRQLLPLIKPVISCYFQNFDTIRNNRILKHNHYLSTIPFSDFKAFEIILQSLSKDSHLQLGNSSTIRYAQLFAIQNSISVFSNRGTSGIEGSTSTAIGAAVANKKSTVLITGDVSFFYDSNALWNSYIPNNFKIILINNGGGGIFRILPGHEETQVFNTFFETSHCLTAEHLAKMYGFDYHIASEELSLKAGLKSIFAQNNSPCILEVFTPTRINDIVLLNYFKQIV